MPSKLRKRQSVCDDESLFEFPVPVLRQCKSAGSSRTFLNFEGWSPKGFSTPPYSSAPGTRSASVCEMYSPKSPSKPPSTKALGFLRTRLQPRRYSDSPDKERSSSRSSLHLKQLTVSTHAKFVDNLLSGGKNVPRFQKRIPTIRTAVRRYESIIFRQRFMALPEEVRNKVYDYVITGDTQDGWGLSENCGNGSVDCSRRIISHDVGDGTNFAHLDDILVLLQGRPYGVPSSSSLSSHPSCTSPSTCYSSRRSSFRRPPMQKTLPKETRLQFSSQDRKLNVYHINPIPTTWPKYVRKGDHLWKELISRWIGHEDARVLFADHFDMHDFSTFEKDKMSNTQNLDPQSDDLPPLFARVSQDSLHETIILQQTHNLHLTLTFHEIPLLFTSPYLARTDSLFSIHETSEEEETHPLINTIHYIGSSVAQLKKLTYIILTLTLYPGPLNDTSSHGYEKYFSTAEELDALWYMLAPLKRVEGVETIVVRRLGSCVRWGRKGSSLFPVDGRIYVVEQEGFPSDW